MLALRYSQDTGLKVQEVPKPQPKHGWAVIRVLIAGVCSTDQEIVKGYVPGYSQTLGHEFVGVVEECESQPEWKGKRVVGEINCAGERKDADPIFNRNHAPGRSVLGIINHDGALAQYLTLPASNLLEVPEGITDEEAAFAEPLAAACRITEQEGISDEEAAFAEPLLAARRITEQEVVQRCKGKSIAVIGDGKLGLLVAQVLVQQSGRKVVHFGRHEHKLKLVKGTQRVLVDAEHKAFDQHEQGFYVTVDATGHPKGLRAAMKITRPLGTIVLKSTCAPSSEADSPQLAEVATVLVVNELTVVGSRCGPFKPALQLLQMPDVKALVHAMTDSSFHIRDGMKAFERAGSKGVIKVQVSM